MRMDAWQRLTSLHMWEPGQGCLWAESSFLYMAQRVLLGPADACLVLVCQHVVLALLISGR